MRLLTEDEYTQAAQSFFTADPEAIYWKTTVTGLVFLVSPDFGEWLNEKGAAINTATLDSLCNPGFKASKGLFSARSNGSYKSKRVSFRLCYLGAGPRVETVATTTK